MSFGTLVITYPDRYAETVDIRKPTLHVGTAYDNDVVLYDDAVALYHTQLLCDVGGYQVLDLGSAGGTFLAGVRVPPQVPTPLPPATPLQLGSVTLICRQPAGAPADEVARPVQEPAARHGTLVITYPDRYAETVDIRKPTLHVGAAYDNDVVLYDDAVALYHAQLLCDVGGYQVLDLGTCGGTFLAGVRVPPQVPTPLPPAAPLQLGPVTIVYHPRSDLLHPGHAGPRWSRRSRQLVAGVGSVLLIGLGGITLYQGRIRAATPAPVALATSDVFNTPVPFTATASPIATPVPSPTVSASVTATPTIAPPVELQAYVVAIPDRQHLNIRREAGLSAPIVGKLTAGTVVQARQGPLTIEGESWIYIESPQGSGWCALTWLIPR